MARKRMINPTIWESALGKLWNTEQFSGFIACISMADDDGRGRVAGAMSCLTSLGVSRENAVTILKSIDCITIYDNDKYYCLPGWKDEQYIQKPSKSTIPSLEEYDSSMVALPEEYGSPTVVVSSKEKKEKKEKKEVKNSGNNNSILIDYNFFINLWNKRIAIPPKRQIRLTPVRKNKIQARIKNPEFQEQYPLILKNIQESDFLAGRKDWTGATIDWLLKNDDNWIKVLEGNYDNPGNDETNDPIEMALRGKT